MERSTVKKTAVLIGGFIAIWLVIRYLFPYFMPFLLGAGLALAAEPIVNFFQTKLRLPRVFSSGIGVCLTLAILILVLVTLGALVFRELKSLAGILPEVRQLIQQGMTSLQDWLLSLASRAPDGIAAFLTQTVLELFSGGAALLGKLADLILGLATGILSRIPDGALGLGTALISCFMISAKLPGIRRWLRTKIPDTWRSRYLPALTTVKASLAHWLRAQGKLASVTFVIVTAGLFILGISHSPLWAFFIALVDAVPLLGTGTIMIPWALVCLLQGEQVLCIGLLAVYAAAAVTRSVLEPKLLGKQMGLDPLLTLAALYLGYRLWGVLGMLLAPMIAATAKQLTNLNTQP